MPLTGAAQSAASATASLPWIWWMGPIGAVVALGFAWYFYRQVIIESEGTPAMIEIAQAVLEGAMAYAILWAIRSKKPPARR